MLNKILYPELEPFNKHTLKVDDIHELYIEEYGNPNGKPILVIHGGPGAGISQKSARLFDPKVWHIIQYDQRGCGKSTPNGCLKNNTTQHLIEDIEKIRKYLKISSWHIMGASWGSTLAILYGQKYPQNCLSFILRGVFLGTKKELEWPEKGAPLFHPEAWEDVCKKLNVPEDKGYNYELLESLLNNKEKAINTAKAFCGYEYRIAQFMPDEEAMEESADIDNFIKNLATIMVHYFKNKVFIDENQIIKNIDEIKHIPCLIVQGRYDMVCPPHYAYKLHKIWRNSFFQIIENANHSGSDESVISMMIRLINKY